MKRQGYGRIVLTTSGRAMRLDSAGPGLLGYCVGKMRQLGLMVGVAAEMRDVDCPDQRDFTHRGDAECCGGMHPNSAQSMSPLASRFWLRPCAGSPASCCVPPAGVFLLANTTSVRR